LKRKIYSINYRPKDVKWRYHRTFGGTSFMAKPILVISTDLSYFLIFAIKIRKELKSVEITRIGLAMKKVPPKTRKPHRLDVTFLQVICV
jgi:hypothetical protein